MTVKHRHFMLDLMGERLVKAFGIFLATWLVGGLGFYAIGWWYGANTHALLPDGSTDTANFSFLNCLFLAAMTVSTLGLADLAMLARVPGGGRDVAYGFMIAYALFSYLLVVYASAQIVGYVVEGALGRYLEKRRLMRDLNATQQHYVVCGLGSTGIHVVAELVKIQEAVVGVDMDAERVKAARALYPDEIFLEGDVTHDEMLETCGVKRARGMFAALNMDKDNILVVLTARQQNPDLRIVARAQELRNVEKLKRVGANVTISPNHIGGLRMASEMVRPAVTTFLDTMLRAPQQTTRFENVVLHKDSPAAGKTLKELDILTRTGLLVVATVKADGAIRYNPTADIRIMGGDAVVVIASPEQKKKLASVLNGEAAAS